MRTLIATSVAALALLSGPGPAHAGAQTTLEDKIKAAIVAKFPQFVEWPAAAVSGRPTIDICVLSTDSFLHALEELAAGEAIGARPLSVRRVQLDSDVDGCHVLFLRAGLAPSSRPLLHKARALAVLTVSDDEHFLDAGGIVRLRQVDGRLRFDVDAGAARKVGLRISSQVLELAVTVREGPPR